MDTSQREAMLMQMVENLERQLVALYREKQNLHQSIGVSDDASIIQMVRSLEKQVNLLYRERDDNHVDND